MLEKNKMHRCGVIVCPKCKRSCECKCLYSREKKARAGGVRSELCGRCS